MLWATLFSLQSIISLSTTVASATSTYPVTDSSQTFCYDEVGSVIPCETSPGSYTDGAYAGLVQSFCNHGDGTVTDMKTGLMWTQQVYGELSYDGASQPFSLAGYSDFRLPTIKELYTLTDFDGYTGSSEEENHPYQNSMFETRYGTTRFIDGQLWSSTQYVSTIFGNENNICNHGLNPIDGRIKCYPTRNGLKFARYVRGVSSVGENSLEEDDDTVQDRATGLQWMKHDSGYGMDWPSALQFCSSINVGGHADWRLPDAHELHSIVDYTRFSTQPSPAIDSDFFESTAMTNEAGQADFGYYWTSTTHLDGSKPGDRAVYIAFGRALGNVTKNGINQVLDVHGAGAQRSDPKVGPNKFPYGHGPQGDIIRINNYVRCVRGHSSAHEQAPNTCNGTLSQDHADTTPPALVDVSVPIVGGARRNRAEVGFRVEVEMGYPDPTVQVKYSKNVDLSAPYRMSSQVTTTSSDDWTGSISLTGLDAGTRYYYSLLVDGKEQPTVDPAVVDKYSFQTMPPLKSADEVKLAIFADSESYKVNTGGPAYASGAAGALMALQIGDMDHSNPLSLEEHRTMHQKLRAASRGGGAYEFATNILSKMSIDHVWDDHDYCGNDSGGDCTSKDAAYEAYQEYWSGFNVDCVNGIYHKFTVGEAEIFMLDTRWNRSPNSDLDTQAKTMLGQAQRDWLLAGLSSSTATWRIICSTVSANTRARMSNTDHWRSFRSEVNKILSYLTDNVVENIVMVTADLHTGGAIDDGSYGWFGFPELSVAHTSLNSGNSNHLGEWSHGVTSGTAEASCTNCGAGYAVIRYTSASLTLENFHEDGTLIRWLTVTPGFQSKRTPFVCKDDMGWVGYRNGNPIDCDWVARNLNRCDGVFADASNGGDTREASQACPLSCGLCEVGSRRLRGTQQ